MSAPDWTKRQLMAEFIATSTFVWAGCGTSCCPSVDCRRAIVFFAISLICCQLIYLLTRASLTSFNLNLSNLMYRCRRCLEPLD